MEREPVTDELWEVIEPLLPPEPPKPRGSRPRIDDRAPLTGIIYHLRARERHPLGDAAPRDELWIGHDLLWRRLKEWEEAEVWEQLHQTLLERLGEADQVDYWERASSEAASVAAVGGGEKTGPKSNR